MTVHSRDSLFQVAEENNFSKKDVFSVSICRLLSSSTDKGIKRLLVICTANSGPTWLPLLPSLCTAILVSWGANQHHLFLSGHSQNGTNSAPDIGV